MDTRPAHSVPSPDAALGDGTAQRAIPTTLKSSHRYKSRRKVSATMEQRLREGQFTEAVLAAVEKVGALLAAQFPRSPEDTNELPDGIVRD